MLRQERSETQAAVLRGSDTDRKIYVGSEMALELR
jgi:hypothetical protein